MTTDAASRAASASTHAPTDGASTGASSSVDGDTTPASTGASGNPSTTNSGVMGPVVASHTRVDSAPALPVSNGTASTAVIGSAVPSMGAGAMFQAVFGLAVVIALVFACGWIARRLGLKPTMRRSGIVKVVGAAALGARERVVVVEVRDTWLVLGVAAGSVRRLHTLPAQDAAMHHGTTTRGSGNESSTPANDTEASRAGTHATDDKPHDALPSFQTALARQLKDRLQGLGRSGNPGGKD
ncbi:flagellar biosynthetic protein FliO [Robbsia andropogonis]|uniref:flagellar biosynthetic protein FliO n=1 Tax=Robbsia andropogonis TaxID=28092 RepID=UPI00069666E7|nr:flagellar biosynthetic protein FliO [Robbsia andropogonis]MCP1118763.1 flagellar biosynthetic protein FliO [Robbsia andropogonis]MCP1128230.1 flagellar biosynthetic protein FliO [Robbsia andropogonis]